MQGAVLLLLVAALAVVAVVRAGVPSNAIFGNFDAVASLPTYGVASWDHAQLRWRETFQAQTGGDTARTLQPLSVTRSDQFFAWDALNGAVFHYNNDTTLSAPAGGATVPRLGRDKLVLDPNGPVKVLASYGAVAVWYCGAIVSIGGNDTGHPNTQQIYEATRLDSYESLIWTLVTPPSLVVTGVDCATLHVFSNDRLLVSDGTGFTPYFLRTGTDDTWVPITNNVSGSATVLWKQGANSDLYAYGSALDGTSPTFVAPTVQRYTGSASTWDEAIPNAYFENDTVADFAVDLDGNVFITYSTTNLGTAPEQIFHVYVSISNGAPQMVTGDQFFATALTTDLTSAGPVMNNAAGSHQAFSLFADPNIGIVAWSPQLAYVLYANVSELTIDDGGNSATEANYSKLFAKAAQQTVVLVWSGSGSPADDPTAHWKPCYGGGIASDIVGIAQAFEGVTFFYTTESYTFDIFTGPLAFWDSGAEEWTASWFADGNGEVMFDYDPLDLADGLNNNVAAVAEFAGGLFVGGYFRTFDSGNPANSLLWLSDPSSDVPWSVLGYGWDVGVRTTLEVPSPEYFASISPGQVYSLTTDGSYLYVGGYFDIAGGQSAMNIARYDPKLNVFWDIGGGLDDAVIQLAWYGGQLVAAGSFYKAGRNVAAGGIAIWDDGKSQWYSLNRGVSNGGDTGIITRVVNWQGLLIVAGQFSLASGRELPNLAAWDGQNWIPPAQLFDTAGDIYTEALFDNLTNTVPCGVNPTCNLGDAGAVLDIFPSGEELYFAYTLSVVDRRSDGYYGTAAIGVFQTWVGRYLLPLLSSQLAVPEIGGVFAAPLKSSYEHRTKEFNVYNWQPAASETSESAGHLRFNINSWNLEYVGEYRTGVDGDFYGSFPTPDTASGPAAVAMLVVAASMLLALLAPF